MPREFPRPVRFMLVGAAAVAASLAAFAIARHLGGGGVAPTAIRLVVSFAVVYVGYTRWMKADMVSAISAIAASSAAKMLIEPWLVADLERRGATAWIDLAPLAGDLVYGPGLAYAVLAIGRAVRGSRPAGPVNSATVTRRT